MTGSRQIVFSSARRAPRRRWTRVVGVIVGIAVAVLVVAVLLAGSLWVYASARLGGDQIAGLDGEVAALGDDAPSAPAGATTVLVTVTAPRDPTLPAAPELRGPAFLVQAGGSREVPAVLALPEDLPVPVEGAPTATVAEVQSQADIDGLVAALRDYSGLRIDHAVSISEDALPRLVEIQGAEVCDEAGRCTELRPEDVRAGQADDAPEARVQATVQALRAVAAELDAVGAVTSPLATKRTIDVISRDVRTDVSLRGTALLDLARLLEDAPAPEVAAMPLLRNPETGGAVLLEEAETLLQRLREGASLADAGPSTPGEVDPAELVGAVDIAVLNGAGIDGLAGQVESRLAAEGFRIVGTGNAPSFSDESTTTITYDPDDPAAEVAAILLAERLEGAALQAAERTPSFEGEPVGVLVIAGADLDDGADR